MQCKMCASKLLTLLFISIQLFVLTQALGEIGKFGNFLQEENKESDGRVKVDTQKIEANQVAKEIEKQEIPVKHTNLMTAMKDMASKEKVMNGKQYIYFEVMEIPIFVRQPIIIRKEPVYYHKEEVSIHKKPAIVKSVKVPEVVIGRKDKV